MSMAIDTTFDVYSDTPQGRDPDSHSPTLRRYHRMLWSKPLPDGSAFDLTDGYPGAYLHHKSELGEFCLSSDSIGHTYRYVKSMSGVIRVIPQADLDLFSHTCSTIGAYIIFPSRIIDRKPTINGARGLHWKIKDRFDLTLECIKRHYERERSPLADTLDRYADFFRIFGSFKGYVDFFLLQDLISENYNSVNCFLPFRDFDTSPLPSDTNEYEMYSIRVADFIVARNDRISRYVVSSR